MHLKEYRDQEQGCVSQPEAELIRITIYWNPKIPEHDAFHRVFKEDDISVIPGTSEFGYSKVKKRMLMDAPQLDLDVSKVESEDMIITIAIKVVDFRKEFERACQWTLTEALFDKRAWGYIVGSSNELVNKLHPALTRRSSLNCWKYTGRRDPPAQAKSGFPGVFPTPDVLTRDY
ncbi:hypothetical protein EDD11_003604 [Mortierella claussenii]|nr:hypothetical protein EDD11_003604 [Mortierella claussenii]